MFHVPNQFRHRVGRMGTTDQFGNNGAFFVPFASHSRRITKLHVICSDGMQWEHVSVSTPFRCPTWEEMCHVKNLFWDADDVVMQLHPAEADYVNNHPYCLHLWRPAGIEIPQPPAFMVGYPSLNQPGRAQGQSGGSGAL